MELPGAFPKVSAEICPPLSVISGTVRNRVVGMTTEVSPTVAPFWILIVEFPARVSDLAISSLMYPVFPPEWAFATVDITLPSTVNSSEVIRTVPAAPRLNVSDDNVEPFFKLTVPNEVKFIAPAGANKGSRRTRLDSGITADVETVVAEAKMSDPLNVISPPGLLPRSTQIGANLKAPIYLPQLPIFCRQNLSNRRSQYWCRRC